MRYIDIFVRRISECTCSPRLFPLRTIPWNIIELFCSTLTQTTFVFTLKKRSVRKLESVLPKLRNPDFILKLPVLWRKAETVARFSKHASTSTPFYSRLLGLEITKMPASVA